MSNIDFRSPPKAWVSHESGDHDVPSDTKPEDRATDVHSPSRGFLKAIALGAVVWVAIAVLIVLLVR
jgi:hypothetical protein